MSRWFRREFHGGSDEKMRRMWFGLEIDVVGLPPLPGEYIGKRGEGLNP